MSGSKKNWTGDKNFNNEELKMEKYKLEVKDGIINITPPAPEYYQIAESIANELAKSGTTEWHEVCLKVINKLDYHSQFIKSKIIGKVSYGTGFYQRGLESVKNRTFQEAKAYCDGFSAKAYCDGFSAAVSQFKQTFEHNERILEKVLDELLPCRNK